MVLASSWSHLRACSGHLGPILEPIWGHLGTNPGPSWANWSHLVNSSGLLRLWRTMLNHFGTILNQFGAIKGPFLGRFWPISGFMGPSRNHFGLFKAIFKPMRDHIEPCWNYLKPFWGQCCNQYTQEQKTQLFPGVFDGFGFGLECF